MEQLSFFFPSFTRLLPPFPPCRASFLEDNTFYRVETQAFVVELPQFASRKNLPTTQQKPQTPSQIYPHPSIPHPLVRGPLSPCLGLHSFHSVSYPFSFSWVFDFSFSVSTVPSALKNCRVPPIFTKTPPSNYPAPITSA